MLYPVFAFKWILISSESIRRKFVELLVIIAFIFVSKYIAKQVGKGDLLVIILLVFFWGVKETFIISILSLICFVIFSCVYLLCLRKGIKTSLPFIPFVLVSQVIYLLIVRGGL